MTADNNKKDNYPVFYHNDDNIEVKIKFKKDYGDLNLNDRLFNMIEDIYVLLEVDIDKKMVNIAKTYD
ncbi:MAG: hypothetical protein KO318_06035 [Methanobacterium sp.]|jgi:hypothetical protein|uniref:hypothetical protein n=1 Tax=Methanobacterium sp. TaxID=2164 RepID=UPI00258EE207|nr:hypothetical protein [Methanobacterium sp.]MCC7559973.1 hypothetical protein [Methanobacterium sp.]